MKSSQLKTERYRVYSYLSKDDKEWLAHHSELLGLSESSINARIITLFRKQYPTLKLQDLE